jgi:hypothetical protein
MPTSPTLLFNEWITLVALHEELLASLGNDLFREYARGKSAFDLATTEICREIATRLARCQEHQDEVLRDFGPSTGLLGRGLAGWFAGRNLASFRASVLELQTQLGRRALGVYDTQPLLEGERHRDRCVAALRLGRTAERKWQEILCSRGRGPATPAAVQLLVQIYNLAGKLQLRPWLYRLLKLDMEREKVRLKRAFAQREKIDFQFL